MRKMRETIDMRGERSEIVEKGERGERDERNDRYLIHLHCKTCPTIL